MTHDTTVEAVADAILPLLGSSDDLKWQVGDILAETNVDFSAVTALLARAGHSVAPSTLRSYCTAARAFPPGQRIDNVSFTTHSIVASSGASEGAVERMSLMLASFAGSGTIPTKRNAMTFFGMSAKIGVSQRGAEEYLADHPELIARLMRENPKVAAAARAGLDSMAEDDGPTKPVRKVATPVVNSSLGHIEAMERSVRGLRSSVPYLDSEDERDEVLERIQGLRDGLHECLNRVDVRRRAA